MPRKKTSDPRLIALMDKREKLRRYFDRAYARMRRSFRQMEKSRLALIRLGKRIDAQQAAPNGV